MKHEACKRAMAAGEVTEEVRGHLEGCEECGAFARTLEDVRAFAPAMAPTAAPEGLADRVVARVREATGGLPAAAPLAVAPTALEEGTRRLGRRLVPALAAVAAVALVAGILVAVPRDGERPPEDMLLAAAQQAEEIGTARLDLSGAVEMTVQLPRIGLPDRPFEAPELPSISPERLEGLPEPMREEFRERVDELHSELERQQEEARQAIELPEFDVPEEISFEASIAGDGAIALPDRLRMRGTVTTVESTPPGLAEPTEFEIVVVGDDAWLRMPDGRWAQMPHRAGPFGPLTLEADGVAQMLRAADGRVEDLGGTTLDGERVRHLRFGVAPGAFEDGATGLDFTVTAEAWVGVDDDLVRQLRMMTEGRAETTRVDNTMMQGSVSTTWRSELTVRLSDFGAPVQIDPPPAEEVVEALPVPRGPSAALYPFGGHLSVSFRSAG